MIDFLSQHLHKLRQPRETNSFMHLSHVRLIAEV